MLGISRIAGAAAFAVAGLMVTACGGTSLAPTPQGALPPASLSAPAAAKAGIYVSAFYDSSTFGFKSNYRTGFGPMCTIFTGQSSIIGIAADSLGNLVVPEGINPGTIVVYQGPDMCGSKLGSFTESYGQPGAAATMNAATGTIIVGNLQAHGNAIGNVAVCTLSGGCAADLTSPNITGYGGGVAVAKNGDCWMVAENSAFNSANLTYWPGCTGSGKATTGFLNTSYGSLSIDRQGNLVSVDFLGGSLGQLWVYSGCNPACKVVGGPFPLKGNSRWGALNAKGTLFGTLETEFPYGGTVDIYKYTPAKLTYQYSFDSSFAPVAGPIGFAYSPALKL
jgi:hypothetical protein